MAKRDYYEVLGVVRDAQVGDIKIAYRKLAMQYHPDRNPGDKTAEDKFKEASEAYEVLSNQETRARYDRFGHQGVNAQGFQDVNDIFSSFGSIFEEFFGFNTSGGARGNRSRRGADLRYDLALEFNEAVFGVEKQVEFDRADTCAKCKGSGAKAGSTRVTCKTCAGAGQVRRSQGFFSIATVCPSCSGEGTTIDHPCGDCRGTGHKNQRKTISVKVPPGVDSGVRLRITEEGEPGPNGGPSGDLYVVLHVKESDRFERDGLDLILRQNIGIAQAALGCKIQVATLEGETSIDVPPGTQFGHRVTLAGAGVPHLKGVGRGDLHIELLIVTPRKLTKEQRELLQKYAEISDESAGLGGNGGFFQRIFSGDS